MEPYYLIFRWSSWYLWAWCESREDFRLFKLNRMDELEETGEHFTKRFVPPPDLSTERIFPGGIRVKALFEPDCKWRLMEEFGHVAVIGDAARPGQIADAMREANDKAHVF